ncbi:MAG: GNAT family N-acetyltransferase [Hyphomonadaceae bacterium]
MNDVRDNAAAKRFEMGVSDAPGALVFADYQRRDGVYAITHVETPAPLRGRGLAGQLMDGILAKARAQGFKIRPICPFAVAHLARHRDQQDLVA